MQEPQTDLEKLRSRLEQAGFHGEWEKEPDRFEWEHNGLPCLAQRNMLMVWCGYVAVPLGHPYYGKDYDSVEISTHGGLTYSDSCSGHICHVPKPGESDKVWWFGFDCGHMGDYLPALHLAERLVFSSFPSRQPGSYRNLAYVKKLVNQLADQLRESAINGLNSF